MENNDIVSKCIKIGCFGESSVGKTYFARRYIKDIKEDDFYLSTVGVEYFNTTRILSDGKNYKIKIIDTAGQERYRSLSVNSIRFCDGIILMYSITDRKSFNLISNWIQNIYDIKEGDFPFILIGNKCDLENQRDVLTEEGIEKAKQYNTIYFETSAKEGINVEQSFEELLKKIIKKNEGKNLKKNNNLIIDSKKKKKKKIFFCF